MICTIIESLNMDFEAIKEIFSRSSIDTSQFSPKCFTVVKYTYHKISHFNHYSTDGWWYEDTHAMQP